MGIRKEPPGLAGMYGQAAVLAGRAAATREAVERGERAAARTMRQYDRGQQVQLALKRMANNNEMIQFREEMDLQTRKEAQLFQLETIKTRANLDFAREERDRQQQQDEVKQGIKAIREYPYLSDTPDPVTGQTEREKTIYDFTMKKQHGYTVPRERALSASAALDKQISGLIDGAATAGPSGAGIPAEGGGFGETEAPTWGWPTLTKPAYRVRPEQPAGDSIMLQAAPDVALNPYWDRLPDEEKLEIWTALQNNPDNLTIILQRLRGGI